MIDLSGWVALIDLIVLIAVSLGVIVAFRSSMANTERIVQDRVITAMKEEREILNRKIEEQKSILSTILWGLKIVIEGDFVTITESGGSSKVTRIQDRSSQLDDAK